MQLHHVIELTQEAAQKLKHHRRTTDVNVTASVGVKNAAVSIDTQVGKLHVVERRRARRRVSGRRRRRTDDQIKHLVQFGLKQRRLRSDHTHVVCYRVTGRTANIYRKSN